MTRRYLSSTSKPLGRRSLKREVAVLTFYSILLCILDQYLILFNFYLRYLKYNQSLSRSILGSLLGTVLLPIFLVFAIVFFPVLGILGLFFFEIASWIEATLVLPHYGDLLSFLEIAKRYLSMIQIYISKVSRMEMSIFFRESSQILLKVVSLEEYWRIVVKIEFE